MEHLFKQVVLDVASDWISVEVERYVHVLSKATAVVVPIGLGTAEGLQNCGGANKDILHTEYTQY